MVSTCWRRCALDLTPLLLILLAPVRVLIADIDGDDQKARPARDPHGPTKNSDMMPKKVLRD
jgi:hypothetical protein